MSIKTYIKGHTGFAILVAVLVVVFGIVGGRMATKKVAEDSVSNIKRVSLVDAGTFRDDLTTVAVEGIVESASQVDLKSQFSAPISNVYVAVGDTVAPGQTIVELQNTDIRAQLEQARANLALAEGQYTAGNVSTDSARKSTIDKLRDIYIKADEDYNGKIKQFLFISNPSAPDLQSYLTESALVDKLSTQMTAVDGAFATWKANINSLTDNSTKEQVTAVLGASQTALGIYNSFLDTLSSALISAERSADQSNSALINSWKATVSGARATNNASISALTTSGTSLSASQAQIQAAQAGVKNLEAQLAKTIIRSPIAGKIAALPFRAGEFVNGGQLVTTVVGSGGLQIKANASSEDVGRIAKNAEVTIEGKIPGVVTSIAPSINQITKKVEVNITVPATERANLVVGQSIQAKIQATKPSNTTREPLYILPIQNVKIVPDAAYVYTVDADSKIVKHPVTLGEVKGDFVEIKTGITDDMKIVSPVYELDEGELVQTE